MAASQDLPCHDESFPLPPCRWVLSPTAGRQRDGLLIGSPGRVKTLVCGIVQYKQGASILLLRYVSELRWAGTRRAKTKGSHSHVK